MQRGQVYRVGKCWLLRWREPVLMDGKHVKKLMTRKIATYGDQYRSKADVQPLADAFLAPLNARMVRAESTQEVAAFLEQVYLPHSTETLKPSTARGYLDMFRLVQPHLNGIQLREVRTPDIEKILNGIAATPKADGTSRSKASLKHAKAFLSGAFRYAKRTGAINENPVHDTVVPKGAPPRETHAYTLDEIHAMLAVLQEPARTAVLVAALTGLRLSEIKGLKWEDFTGDELRVARSVWNGVLSETKTQSSHAAVPLLPIVKRALQEHRKRTPDGFIFQGGTGEPMRLENTVRRDIRPALLKAGLEWHGWHAFRRGLATNLYALGATDRTAQAILRHANVATTMAYYVKPVASESVAAMRKLETAFAKSGARRAKLA